MITSICKKGTQSINYFARKKDGKINKMKAIKLIYLADRYHIRKYGRPIVGDVYWAMKYGPVGSDTLNLANLSKVNLEKDCLKYAQKYISHSKGDVKIINVLSKQEVDLEVFSQSDIDALENVYKEFGDKDNFELAEDITHRYPEWERFRKDIEGGKRRIRMDYIDFFKNPKKTDSSVFMVSEEQLALSKEAYLENKEIADILG